MLNPTRRFLARGDSLDTFVISKASTQKEDQAVVAQACFFASSFSAFSRMGRGHQLIGVWPESPASAKIKTAKISSEESARFSAKICTSENFPLYGTSLISDMTFLYQLVQARPHNVLHFLVQLECQSPQITVQ